MRIKDLPEASTLAGSEFLAVDSNNGTKKATIDAILGGMDDAIQALQDQVDNLDTDINDLSALTASYEPIRINIASFSSLPQTVSYSAISADMVVLASWLSNPSAQTGDWTVTTSDGAVVVSGTIATNKSTALTLILGKANV